MRSIAKLLERRTANAKVATVLGSISQHPPTPADEAALKKIREKNNILSISCIYKA